MNEFKYCSGDLKGGIKKVYFVDMPINLDKIDFTSELSEYEAKEVKERGGIDCVILSPSEYKLYKDVKEKMTEYERIAEEYFQEVEDGEEEGNLYMVRVDECRRVLKTITGGKPVLNELSTK